MKNMNRRELCLALSAFAALGGAASFAQSKDEKKGSMKMAGSKKSPILSKSETFRYDKLPVVKEASGGEFRHVISGTLVTGEYIEVHETTLPAGKMPHPPHRHRNSELLFIRQGDLVYLNDGKPEPVGPGDVVFTASNVLHGLKNVGTTPAMYFVIAISHA